MRDSTATIPKVAIFTESIFMPITKPAKFIGDRPFTDPEAAFGKILKLANSAEAVQDGRIDIELIK